MWKWEIVPMFRKLPLACFIIIAGIAGQDTTIYKLPPEEKTMVGIYGNGVVQTLDEGFAVAGWIKYQSVRYRDHDLWVLKADKAGREIWQRRLGGKSTDRANSLIQTKDGGLAVAGETYSFGDGTYDMWLIRLDAEGNVLWHETIGDKAVNRAYALCQTIDGGFALAGFTESPGAGKSDGWLVKTDMNGNVEWSKTFGGKGLDRLYAVLPTSEGGYFLAGYTTTNSAGGLDIWVIRTNAKGELLWERTIGGKKDDRARAAVLTGDGGFLIVGGTYSKGNGLEDLYCIKFSKSGAVEWEKVYGGHLTDGATSIALLKHGGFVLAGYTESAGAGYRDGWLMRLDEKGEKVWDKTYGGKTTDQFNSVAQTVDGGFILSGFSKSTGYRETDVWVLKTDESGKVEWEQIFKEPQEK